MQTKSILGACSLITSIHHSCVAVSAVADCKLQYFHSYIYLSSHVPPYQSSSMLVTLLLLLHQRTSELQSTAPASALVIIGSSCIWLRSRTIFWTHKLKFLSGAVDGEIIAFWITWVCRKLFLLHFSHRKIYMIQLNTCYCVPSWGMNMSFHML